MSFLFYDLETFGIDPRKSRIAQFAAIRTDDELRIVDEPVSLFCAPALDLLPSPQAALVTGLTPQSVAAHGICEAECFARINALLREPGTCTAGWNTLRFDDEFIRYGLYRNFHDPYAREWENGNSRWDLLDYARLAHALRPDGITWPKRDDGLTSFRLEHLAEANGIVHTRAHDALSDVEATLGMARRLRAAQPKLWTYHLGFRSKARARSLLDPTRTEPLLHVSGRFPAERGCASLVLPLAEHPASPNQIIVLDLHEDAGDWLDATPEEIAERVFVARDALADGVARIGLKVVHLNRSPALAELRHVGEPELARLRLDRAACVAHAARVRAARGLAERVRQVFVRAPDAAPPDVDHALYAGLPERRDARVHAAIRAADPDQLHRYAGCFTDPRGDELLFRYRARNWPQTLDTDDRQRWTQYCRMRLSPGSGLSEYDPASYRAEIDALRADATLEANQRALLDQLDAWGTQVEAALGCPL